MNHRWVARGLVVGLHLALLTAMWQHRAPAPADAGERRMVTVRLIQPPPRVKPALNPPRPSAMAPPRAEEPWRAAPPPTALDAPAALATAPEAAPAVATPTEAPRTALRLTLPPGYAASANAERNASVNAALRDPRSNTPRLTLEDRIADATGGAGAWVEEQTSENRLQAVGAVGEHRTVMRRGNTCFEILRSRITDVDPFNGNVAPRAISMVGKPYKCR